MASVRRDLHYASDELPGKGEGKFRSPGNAIALKPTFRGVTESERHTIAAEQQSHAKVRLTAIQCCSLHRNHCSFRDSADAERLPKAPPRHFAGSCDLTLLSATACSVTSTTFNFRNSNRPPGAISSAISP